MKKNKMFIFFCTVILFCGIGIIPFANAQQVSYDIPLDNWSYVGATPIVINPVKTNWTITIDVSSMRSTNGTGTHTYVFYFLDITGNGTIVEFQNLNGTRNDVYINDFYMGTFPTVYQAPNANVSTVRIDYRDNQRFTVKFDNKVVFERIMLNSNLESIVYNTQDISEGTPAAFQGNIYLTVSNYGQFIGTSPTKIMDLIIPIAIIVVVITMLSGIIAKRV